MTIDPKLRAELVEDPLGRYAGLGAREIFDRSAVVDRTVYVDVPLGTLAGQIEMDGVYERLEAAPDNAAARKLLRLARGETQIRVLEYSVADKRAAIDALLDQLVADAVIDTAGRTALQALGTRTVSRWQEIGLGWVEWADVAEITGEL
jgi:hypothetical protein